MEQAVAVLGAILILGAYVAHQSGRLDRTQPAYHWMNLIGSVILTIVAFRARQWGFVLLEGVWAIVSVPPLLRRRGGL
jgi:hypothetical protein